MFQLLSKLFSPSEPSQQESAQPSHAAMPDHVKLNYHPELVDQLKKEHRTLVSLLSSTTKQLSMRQMEAARKEFTRFTRVLHGHLLKENLKLYTYLKHALSNDPDNQELAVRFQTDMGKIGRQVDIEVKKLSGLDWDPSDAKTIIQTLDGIGKALLERVHDEEAYLYPLYDQQLTYQ